ncbi:MAG: hypothetical protein ACXABY_25235 [Candidatus Thorarchaeota archaeon]|jgi:hypothetical protein
MAKSLTATLEINGREIEYQVNYHTEMHRVVRVGSTGRRKAISEWVNLDRKLILTVPGKKQQFHHQHTYTLDLADHLINRIVNLVEDGMKGRLFKR